MLQLAHEHLSLSISEHDHSCGCDHALFHVLKLSYGLVWAGRWAHPNGNLVLNCAGSNRRFLRTKVARWKEHSSSESAKDPCASPIGMDGVLLQVPSWKEGCYAWSLVATSHIRALSLLLLLNLMNISLSLFVSNPHLTFLACACISFTPNWVYCLVYIYHWAISLWVCKWLPTTIAL
jgi:hypothetical protein